MSRQVAIMWFRQDLRVKDNPALVAAAKAGTVLPIYILDDENAGDQAMASVSRWWLRESLNDLNKTLDNKLSLYCGDAKKIIDELCERYNVLGVYWNRCYEPWRIQRDKTIKKQLQEQGITAETFNGSLLWEPWDVSKKDGTPYKVFTPFYRKGCLQAQAPRDVIQKPRQLQCQKDNKGSLKLTDLALMPEINWYAGIAEQWQPGEKGAEKRLQQFLDKGLANYKKGRDFPALSSVSRLSPHLHFGELSPNQVWYAAKSQVRSDNLNHFCSELGWREFSYSLLYYFPQLPKKNWQEKFNRFPWKNNQRHLRAWQLGLTGYPIIDAGMRELWQTGYMHNRVRMIVGSFLVKNLLIHWRKGEAWFWDCLCDADLANNSASWQWVAGCGADAAPYFRVFNPVLQGQKFDGQGEYTRQYVPELKNMPDKYLFNPWEAPDDVLQKAGVVLGKHYPKPIVDLKASRQRALEAYKEIK